MVLDEYKLFIVKARTRCDTPCLAGISSNLERVIRYLWKRVDMN
jgi:hypothetical protein